MKKKGIIWHLAIGVAVIGVTGWFLFRLMNGMFETGQVPDEAYRTGTPALYRRENYAPLARGRLFELPPANGSMGFDLRSSDLSALSLVGKERELKKVTFNTATVWGEGIPEVFDPEKVMEAGKNPGLGIRSLHEMGWTGRGVSIAVIDQGLNPDHEEYRDQLMGYELLHAGDDSAAVHGSAVMSIAVGRSCGVAPEAEVYYISSTYADRLPGGYHVNVGYIADGIDRVLEINQLLPKEKKIRVISISMGIEGVFGSRRVKSAIERAKRNGIFVLTTTPEANYGFTLRGLGRDEDADPDDPASYGAGAFWADDWEWRHQIDPEKSLLVPMDARAYADHGSVDGYEYCSVGGLSWAVPWLSGLYALCVEKKPQITPEEFIEKALSTGIVRTIAAQNGATYRFGTIVDPAALLDAL